MALIKRTLSGITASFTKTLNELDLFISEQQKRQAIADGNIIKLADLADVQNSIHTDASEQIRQAVKVKSKIAALIE